MPGSVRIPPLTRALGVGGLVPFLVFAALLYLPLDEAQHVLARGLLLSYAALILSFLGAVHWGLALARSGPTAEPDALALLWGVCPSLIGWSALMLPPPATAALLAGGFALQWWMDWRCLDALGAPPWYLRLRSGLSVVVLACLAATGLTLI